MKRTLAVIASIIALALGAQFVLADGYYPGILAPFIAIGGNTAIGIATRMGWQLTVMDFGAKCDGATNDSTPFQSALNSGNNIVVPSGVNCVVGNVDFNSGSGQTFETNGASLTIAAGSQYGIKVEGFQPHLRGFYINDAGATVSQTTVSGALATSVSKATVVSGGSGGSAGTCTLTGTTGTGTVFVGTIVNSGASLTAGASVTIGTAGAYSANPTNYQVEPVVATSCGSLAGVTLAFDMTGPTSVTVASAANGPGIIVGQRYQLQESNGAYKSGFVTGVAGNTVAISDGPDVPVVSSAPFWATFGTVYVTNANRSAIDDVRCNGAWGCFNFDDPSAGSDTYKGVNYGTLTRPGATGGSMFGISLGRNVQTETIAVPQITGGWNQVDSFTGTGSQTVFALKYFLNLTREMSSVTVGGVTQSLGTNYTINTNGLGITFAVAPTLSAAIVATYFTYGGVGISIDCNNQVTTACGGNIVSDYNFLQWSDDIYLDKSNGDFFSNGVADAGAWSCLTADGTTKSEFFSAHNSYWCASQIRAKNTAAGVSILTGTSTVQPSAYPSSGVAGALSSLDIGTSVDWPGGIKSSTGKVFVAGGTAQTQYNNVGQICWGCPPGVSPSQFFEWYNSGGTLTWNGTNTLAYSGTYSYLNNNAASGQLAVQATGSGGLVSIQGKASVNLTVNGVNEVNCTTTACTTAEPSVFSARVNIADKGACTMSSGTCAAQSLSGTYSAAPICVASWTGAGTLTGALKVPSTTTTVTPASSLGTDTAVVNWQCFGN